MKNFHLRLPEQTYSQLIEEAERTNVLAATLAREAIDLWLRHQKRLARHASQFLSTRLTWPDPALTSIASLNPQALSTSTVPLKRTSEKGRGLLGRPCPTVRVGADGPPPRYSRFPRRVQPDAFVDIGYRGPVVNIRVPGKALGYRHRDPWRRLRLTGEVLRSLPPGHDTGSIEAHEHGRRSVARTFDARRRGVARGA
jgi:hypothetical protein